MMIRAVKYVLCASMALVTIAACSAEPDTSVKSSGSGLHLGTVAASKGTAARFKITRWHVIEQKDANTLVIDGSDITGKVRFSASLKDDGTTLTASSYALRGTFVLDKSTLTVNSYNTDIFYDTQNPYTIDELNFNYIARFEIPQVVINEQMAPLFGMDIKLKNDMTFKFDYKKSRTLAMSFIDYQLAETRSTGYSAGFGYRMKNVNIGFLTGKKTKKSRKSKKNNPPGAKPPTPGGNTGQQANDMNFKFDFEVRDDITVNHRLDQLEEAVPTRGARTISINPSVEYALNKRLSLRLFTDYRKTVPKTSQSFPITTVNAGVTVQFKLN